MCAKLLRLAALAMLLSTVTMSAATPSLYEIPLRDIREQPATLAPYQGKVLLIVNVASECGYTPQYEGLQALYAKYKDQGLVVLGFPANDFGQQEPGSNAQIEQFCQKRFAVTFPMFAKIHVTGADQHPLYAALTGKESRFPGPVRWNFGKFLIGRDGQLLSRYGSDTEPDSADLVKAIEQALATK